MSPARHRWCFSSSEPTPPNQTSAPTRGPSLFAVLVAWSLAERSKPPITAHLRQLRFIDAPAVRLCVSLLRPPLLCFSASSVSSRPVSQIFISVDSSPPPPSLCAAFFDPRRLSSSLFGLLSLLSSFCASNEDVSFVRQSGRKQK